MDNTPITSLTGEQKRQLDDFAALWTQIGRATGEASMDVAGPILSELYQVMKQTAPYMAHVKSAREAHLLLHVLKHIEPDDLPQRKSRGWTVPQLAKALRSLELFEGSAQCIWHFCQHNTYRSVLREIRRILLHKSIKCVSPSLYGSYEAHWIAYYKFPDEFLRPIHTAEQRAFLHKWSLLAQNCGLVFAFDVVCIVCDRPIIQAIDAEGRLHAPDGPAMAFGDGWQMFYWHGTPVEERIIMNPASITVQEADSERNVEKRRIMIERMGQDRYIRESDSHIVDVDPRWGTLYERTFSDDEPIKMIHYICPSTGRLYWHRVPPNIQSAHAAVAWQFGFDRAEDYHPIYES